MIRDASSHGTILLVGNAALDAFCAGNGTSGNITHPYLIRDYKFTGISPGNSSNPYCIEIRDTNLYLEIKNCTINPTSMDGIKLVNCTHVTIKNCTILRTGNGIYLDQGKNITISRTSIQNSSNNGVQITGSRDVSIIACNIMSPTGMSLYLYSSNNTSVINNTLGYSDTFTIDLSSNYDLVNFTGNNISGRGIVTDHGKHVYLHNNTFHQSGLMTYMTTTAEMATFNIDTSNHIDGKTFYYYVNQTHLNTNDFLNAGEIVLVNCNDSTIDGITLKNTYGLVQLQGSNGCIVQHVTIKHCLFTLYLVASSGNFLEGNWIENISMQAFVLVFYSNDNLVENNTIIRCHYGVVSAFGSTNNTFKGNIVEYCDPSGISFSLSNNNTITKNFLYNNTGYGVEIDSGSNDNLVYDNTFVKNNGGGIQGYDRSTNSTWDNGTWGNVWDDYMRRYPHWSRTGFILNNSYGIASGSHADRFPVYNPWYHALKSHAAISIDGNAALDAFCAGNSTNGLAPATAHVIENMFFDLDNATKCISIHNTNRYLIIRNCALTNTVPDSTYDYAVDVSNCTNIVLENNTVAKQFTVGFSTYSSNNLTLERNTFTIKSIDGAICLANTNHTVVHSNLVINDSYGIRLHFSCYDNISSNTMIGCGVYLYGLYLKMVNTHSIDTANTVNGMPVYYKVNSTHVTEAAFPGAGQVIMANCNDSRIAGMNFSYVSAGITILGGKNNSISSMTMSHCYSGILLSLAENVTISGSSMIHGGNGIMLLPAWNCTVKISDIVDNDCGIAFIAGHLCTSNQIIACNISNNKIGAYFAFTYIGSRKQANVFADNIISGNKKGLWLLYGANNTFSHNNITANEDGIYLEYSVDNYFALNAVWNNSNFSAYGCNGNDWDNGTLGNYWGDYHSRYPFATNDSITWDTQYQIFSSSDADRHPLVHPFVMDKHPSAIFTANKITIIKDQQVQFTFTGLTGDMPATFQWNFGDGTLNVSDANPVHAFTSTGIFTINLTVIDKDGDVAFLSRLNYITVVPDLTPTASFSMNATTIIKGQSVNFTFTGSPGNTPAIITWRFGDGSSPVIGTSINHAYNTPGVFTVNLTITDADGDIVTTEMINCIHARVPAPSNFALTSTAGNPDGDGTFTVNWTPASGVMNYSLYRSSRNITDTRNTGAELVKAGLTNNSYTCIGIGSGTYYFILVAINDGGNTTSNCVCVVVTIISEPPTQDPLVKFLLENAMYIIAGIVGIIVIGVIVAARRRTTRKKSARKDSSIKLMQDFASGGPGNTSLSFAGTSAQEQAREAITKAPEPATPGIVTGTQKFTFYCPNCMKYMDLGPLNPDEWHSCLTCGGMLSLVKNCPSCSTPVGFTKEQFKQFSGKNIECANCKHQFPV